MNPHALALSARASVRHAGYRLACMDPSSAAPPSGPSMWLAFWALLPFHAALPFALVLLHGRMGYDTVTYVVAAIHLVFPALYLGIRRWLPRSTFDLLMLLLLNHLVIAAAGLGSRWLPG